MEHEETVSNICLSHKIAEC